MCFTCLRVCDLFRPLLDQLVPVFGVFDVFDVFRHFGKIGQRNQFFSVKDF